MTTVSDATMYVVDQYNTCSLNTSDEYQSNLNLQNICYRSIKPLSINMRDNNNSRFHITHFCVFKYRTLLLHCTLHLTYLRYTVILLYWTIILGSSGFLPILWLCSVIVSMVFTWLDVMLWCAKAESYSHKVLCNGYIYFSFLPRLKL